MSTVQVRGAMEIALFIENLQQERAEVALYIFNTIGNTTLNLTNGFNINETVSLNKKKHDVMCLKRYSSKSIDGASVDR